MTTPTRQAVGSTPRRGMPQTVVVQNDVATTREHGDLVLHVVKAPRADLIFVHITLVRAGHHAQEPIGR